MSVPWIEGQALVGSNRGTGIRGSLIADARGGRIIGDGLPSISLHASDAACPRVKVGSRDAGRFWLGGAECLSPAFVPGHLLHSAGRAHGLTGGDQLVEAYLGDFPMTANGFFVHAHRFSNLMVV